jgi:hypothetical protein
MTETPEIVAVLGKMPDRITQVAEYDGYRVETTVGDAGQALARILVPEGQSYLPL